MKKSSLIILCMLGYPANSQAQTLIPKLGASLSTIDINGTSSVKNKIGFIGGIALELLLHGKFSITNRIIPFSPRAIISTPVEQGPIFCLSKSAHCPILFTEH